MHTKKFIDASLVILTCLSFCYSSTEEAALEFHILSANTDFPVYSKQSFSPAVIEESIHSNSGLGLYTHFGELRLQPLNLNMSGKLSYLLGFNLWDAKGT
jgi:hypothetical protein